MTSVTCRDPFRRFLSVREGGVEPPRPCGHWNLNPARLPIPPPAHWVCPPAPALSARRLPTRRTLARCAGWVHIPFPWGPRPRPRKPRATSDIPSAPAPRPIPGACPRRTPGMAPGTEHQTPTPDIEHPALGRHDPTSPAQLGPPTDASARRPPSAPRPPAPCPRTPASLRPRAAATSQGVSVHVSTSYRSRASLQEAGRVHSRVRDTGLRPPLRSMAGVPPRSAPRSTTRSTPGRCSKRPSGGKPGGVDTRRQGRWGEPPDFPARGYDQ